MDVGQQIENLETIAGQYDVSKDFDLYNTMMATRIMLPYCSGKSVMEIGCATGEMTEELIEVAAELTVIEPSSTYCDFVSDKLRAKNAKNVTFLNCFISDYAEDKKFDVIVLAALLHHLENPAGFLMRLKRFLHSDSVVLATVPNMTSLHRRIGAKAGLLNNLYGTTTRNEYFKQSGRFDIDRFENVFRSNGFEVTESYGYMLKPFNSSQMMSLDLEMPVINALFELGKEFQTLASQLFIRAALPKGDI